MQDAPLLIDVNEAARRLSVGRTTIFQLIASGELETIKVGRLRRVPVAALETYVEAQRAGTSRTTSRARSSRVAA